MDRSELFVNCNQIVSRDKLEEKLKGRPDFVLEEYYCKGVGKYCTEEDLCVQLVAKAHFPTRFGMFTLFGFYDGREDKEHTAIVRGDVNGKPGVPLRVHSQCHTGDVLGSLRCDCRDQLEAALRFLGSKDSGVLIYLMQEGRGIGLLNKIKAYQLQDLGLDTVEANHFLGYPAEGRDYRVAASIIRLLGIQSIDLLTNNPDKIEKLQKEGIIINDRIPLVVEPNPYDELYLQTKKEKMRHLF